MTELRALTSAEVDEFSKPQDPATKGFLLLHTMYRIKDPKKSLLFYTGVLGMILLVKLDFPESKFSLYFMGYENPADIPKDPHERGIWGTSRRGIVELTHNWGTENDAHQAYHSGNSDPLGYGHIGLRVPNVTAACERFDELGIEFAKRPSDGPVVGPAIIKDPDGYWISIDLIDSKIEHLFQSTP